MLLQKKLQIMFCIKVMKNTRVSITAAICLGLLAFVFILLLSLTSVTDSSRTRERKRLEMKLWDPPSPSQSEPNSPITCDRTHNVYDLCSINGPTVLDPINSTFFFMGPTNSAQPPSRETIRPYPRKWETPAMARTKELTLTSGPKGPPCEVQHNTPAIVFSAGGYTGNFFHDFNDGFVPLFITINSLFRDQNIVLVITNCHGWWPGKYAELLPQFSRHPIINMDNQTVTHCFPSVIVGLISHGPMTMDPTLLPHSKTILDFQTLLERAYGRGRGSVSLSDKLVTRPKLVLVSRRGNVGRVILNQEEVKEAAENVGFDVIVFQPSSHTDLGDAFGLIHASHAMVGVHGAGLTHSLFLRPGSVLVQVVPIGTEWLSGTFFGKPARKLGLKYIEYKIRAEESSLMEKYGKNDLVVENPKAVVKGNWSNMHVYLKEQDVKLDIVSFQRCLKKAYEKAKQSMNKESILYLGL